MPDATIQTEVDARLKKLARQVKIDGFRPGKVPMNIVTQRYGYSVHYEVMNDKVGEAFSNAANEAKLRVAGQPRITEKEGAAEGEVGERDAADRSLLDRPGDGIGAALREQHARHHRGDAEAQVDDVAVGELLRGAAGDDQIVAPRQRREVG